MRETALRIRWTAVLQFLTDEVCFSVLCAVCLPIKKLEGKYLSVAERRNTIYTTRAVSQFEDEECSSECVAA